jgi:predicted oxidoreductase
MATIPSTRSLGSLGTVGSVAYGCWRFTTPDVGAAADLISTALDAGLNLVDTADVYGLDWGGTGFGTVEELLGKVLAARPELRDRMILATKAGIRPPVPYDSSPTYLRSACEASLRRLGVDTIDLYQIHRPDLYTHPAEVAAVLAELVASGKVRAVGVSNHTPAQIDALVAHLDVPLVSTQPEFSAFHLQPMRDGSFDQAMRLDITPLAWSPLAGGKLATGEGLRTELTVALDRVAAAHGADRAQVALAFVLHHPSRPIPIIGSQRPERISQAIEALSLELTRSDLYDIVQSSEGVKLP